MISAIDNILIERFLNNSDFFLTKSKIYYTESDKIVKLHEKNVMIK